MKEISRRIIILIEMTLIFLFGLICVIGGMILFVYGYILYGFLSYILAILSCISIYLINIINLIKLMEEKINGFK